MKIVKLMGGLGNQMFEYAFGVKLGNNTKYDISWFDFIKNVKNLTKREYELDFFNVNPDLINNPKPRLFGFIKVPHIAEKPANIYNSKNLKRKHGYFDGYFQVAQYYDSIREKLLIDFTPRNTINEANQNILNQIKKCNAVSLHVRRGDYLQLQHVHGLCDLYYYKNAIDYVNKNTKKPVFFIFSDDINWCKTVFTEQNFVFVNVNSGRDSAWDMWLMSKCNHNIIANSSFSWWGAWLNNNKSKIVVAPKVWMADGSDTDIVPQDWIRM